MDIDNLEEVSFNNTEFTKRYRPSFWTDIDVFPVGSSKTFGYCTVREHCAQNFSRSFSFFSPS